MQERRRQKRQPISYYMTIMDSNTGQIIGQLMDLTLTGIRIDSHLQFPPGEQFAITLELPAGISDRPFLSLLIRSVWCKPDEMVPNSYNVGLKILELTPEQAEIVKVIATSFGKP